MFLSIVTLTLFGFYIISYQFLYLHIHVYLGIWVIIILICSCCYCCCCCCFSFCCCFIVTIRCCIPDIGLWLMAGSRWKFMFHKGETDVATLGVRVATLVADWGSWSCLNQHSASWLLFLLHVFVRKYLQTILLRCSHVLW